MIRVDEQIPMKQFQFQAVNNSWYNFTLTF